MLEDSLDLEGGASREFGGIDDFLGFHVRIVVVPGQSDTPESSRDDGKRSHEDTASNPKTFLAQ